MTPPRALDARTIALLDERSAALARRGGARTTADAGKAYLVCACGAERYGLPLAEVAAVLGGRACTPVPGAPPALAGIVALSGGIVGVIDLGRVLGAGRSDTPIEHGHLVRLRAPEPPVALAVERVLGIAHRRDSADADRADEDLAGFGAGLVSSYAAPGSGSAATASDGFSIVDLPRLLRRVTS